MELEGNSNAGTSASFLMQLRERHPGPLNVIWDNAPAHRGEALREYLRTPGLSLRLANLPGYSPDCNADEAIWGWVREEATGKPVPGNQGPGAGAGRQLHRSGWPAGAMKSNGAAAPSCNQGLRGSRETSGPIPQDLKMHIPPWLWFSYPPVVV